MAANTGDDGTRKRGRYWRRSDGRTDEQKECLRDLRDSLKEINPGTAFQQETGVDPQCRGMSCIRLMMLLVVMKHVMDRFDAVGAKHIGLVNALNAYLKDLSAVHDDWMNFSKMVQANKHTTLELLGTTPTNPTEGAAEDPRLEKLRSLVGAGLMDRARILWDDMNRLKKQTVIGNGG